MPIDPSDFNNEGVVKISVVTAVYNRADTIAGALHSVQSQTYQNIEHIIQDGASTDGTLGILQKTSDPRVSLITERDTGIYDAINKGKERATPRKLMDVSRLDRMGWRARIPLEDGIRDTYDWFLNQDTDALRTA